MIIAKSFAILFAAAALAGIGILESSAAGQYIAVDAGASDVLAP